MKNSNILVALAAAASLSAPASAKDDAPLAKCAAPHGTVALVDGDTQGWTKLGLGSPRDLLRAMITESNCFTMHDPSSARPADFLMSAIAGDKEEVDQGINVARAALTEGALRTGALGAASSIPVAGAALRLFSGFGGKKKTVAAGLRLVNPTTGQTLIAASGQAKKSSLSWGGVGGYGSSKDGKLLSAAFGTAYNSLVSQSGSLASLRPAVVNGAK
jgi:hypothetical protein